MPTSTQRLPTIQRILVPTDVGPAAAAAALRMAFMLGRRLRATVYVLHVLSPSKVGKDKPLLRGRPVRRSDVPRAALPRSARVAAAQDALSKLARRVLGVKIRPRLLTMVLSGATAAVIARTVRGMRIDLVVMGGEAIGATSRRVAERTKASLLLVRPPRPAARRAAPKRSAAAIRSGGAQVMSRSWFQPNPAGEATAFDLEVAWRSVRGIWTGFLGQLPYIALGLLVFGAFLILARVIRRVVHGAGVRTSLDVTLADLIARIAGFAISVLGLFVAMVVVLPSFKPGDLMAGLGISSVAIGFALKDVLQNFFAGVLILWRKPFLVGDQIASCGYEGRVEEINVRSTRLRTYDGERAVLPNGDVYTSAILVRTAYEQRRVRFQVGIGYPDSIDEARATIHGVLERAEGVAAEPAPWVYVVNLGPSSVDFAVYFWTASDQANVLRVSDRVATAIKLALDGAGIDMPFPHTVVLFHDTTGTRAGDVQRSPAALERAPVAEARPQQSPLRAPPRSG